MRSYQKSEKALVLNQQLMHSINELIISSLQHTEQVTNRQLEATVYLLQFVNDGFKVPAADNSNYPSPET